MFKVALIPIERTIEDMLHTTKLKISSFGVGLKAGFFSQFCTLSTFRDSFSLNHAFWANKFLQSASPHFKLVFTLLPHAHLLSIILLSKVSVINNSINYNIYIKFKLISSYSF